jgi:hypothetical protein
VITKESFTPPQYYITVDISPALSVGVMSPDGVRAMIDKDLESYCFHSFRGLPAKKRKELTEHTIKIAREIEYRYEIGIFWRMFRVEYVAAIIAEAAKHGFHVEYVDGIEVHILRTYSLDKVNQFIDICKQVKYE